MKVWNNQRRKRSKPLPFLTQQISLSSPLPSFHWKSIEWSLFLPLFLTPVSLLLSLNLITISTYLDYNLDTINWRSSQLCLAVTLRKEGVQSERVRESKITWRENSRKEMKEEHCFLSTHTLCTDRSGENGREKEGERIQKEGERERRFVEKDK